MGELIEATGRGRRLKSLDEFEAPAFVGRMNRIKRRRKLVWFGTIAAAAALGGVIGLALF